MRTLHIAALAFPTPQGTQGALHAMLSALATHGHETHLLCYPAGDGEPGRARPYVVHRARTSLKQRSTRSGPSAEKVLLDLALARRAKELCAALSPDLVVAHHVEAACCALALSRPALFVAHTSLRAELPSYFPARLSRATAGAGARLDRFLCARHPGALAVSPLLAEMLTRESGRPVTPIAVPWALAEPATAPERAAAQRALGLSGPGPVLLYAGNLDAYQGLQSMLPDLACLARARPTLTWLIATESESAAFSRELATFGLLRQVRFTRLADEAARRRVHAASDLALVPRGAAGGLPIKLLDALARGIPVVTSRMALAGLPIPAPAVTIVDEHGSWELAIRHQLRRADSAHEHGRAFLAEAHRASRFVSDMIAHAGRWRLFSPPRA